MQIHALGIIIISIGIDCGSISVPLNGAIAYETDTRLDSIAEFSCERGFRLIGDAARTCLASGDWSLSSPSCKSKRFFTDFEFTFNYIYKFVNRNPLP